MHSNAMKFLGGEVLRGFQVSIKFSKYLGLYFTFSVRLIKHYFVTMMTVIWTAVSIRVVTS